MITNWQTITAHLRKRHGSLSKAAKVLKIDKDMLRQLDRGEVQNPRYQVGKKLEAVVIVKPYPKPTTYGQVLANFEARH